MPDNYDKVSLLLPMNGANNGTVFDDYSPVPRVLTRAGVTTTTAQSKYYGSSAIFNGSSDYLRYSPTITLTSGDFTIQAWVYVTATGNRNICGTRPTALVNGAVMRRQATTGRLTFFMTGGSIVESTGAVALNEWVHVAVTRSGNTLRLFINGTNDGTNASTSNGTVTTLDYVAVGSQGDSTSVDMFQGYMQDFEISSTALYTANFTPPTRLIGTLSNAAVGAGKILDAAGNPAERTVFAVPRSAPVRTFSTVSNSSGEFEIQAPAGLDHSVVALADEATLYNDIVHRVIPE